MQYIVLKSIIFRVFYIFVEYKGTKVQKKRNLKSLKTSNQQNFLKNGNIPQ